MTEDDSGRNKQIEETEFIKTYKLEFRMADDLRMSDSVLIIGNGGINEDADLSGYVITLQKLDTLLKEAIRNGIVSIEETNITGTENTFEL